MAHLDEFVKNVISEGLAKKTANGAEVSNLAKVISDENASITEAYAKIGELYVQQHSDDADESELGKMVADVKASKKTIKDSKLKIGELMGVNFCPTCCEEVDEDALYCNNCGAKMPVKLLPGMVLCPHCNKAVREGIRFCTNCGGSMLVETPEEKEEKKSKEGVKTCPFCGWETDDMDVEFCDGCGMRISESEEVKAAEEKKEPCKKVCPSCGWSIFDAETMFCDKCGMRLEEAE